MKNKERLDLICSTYETTSQPSLVKETIEKVKSILWFKKIVAFSWWWSGININDDINLKKNVDEYSDKIKYRIIETIMMRLKDYDVAILTWWTNWDIPNIASQLARKYELATIWVLPEKWRKNSLWKEFLNAEIFIPPIYWDSHYWDESSVFAKLADGMFVIWGGSWTLVEFSHVMKINEKLFDVKSNLKKIVPIEWVPWVSDKLHFIPWKPEVKDITLPNKSISNPKEAFEWLRKELDLDDILREEY